MKVKASEQQRSKSMCTPKPADVPAIVKPRLSLPVVTANKKNNRPRPQFDDLELSSRESKASSSKGSTAFPKKKIKRLQTSTPRATASSHGSPVFQTESSNSNSSSDSDDGEAFGSRDIWRHRFEKAMSFNRGLSKKNRELRKELTLKAHTTSSQHSMNDQNQQLLTLLSETLINRQATVSASALGPCTAQDGGEIQITDWECWKKQFEAWLKASNVSDSGTKQVYFDIYAGSKLSIALATAPEISDSISTDYDLTVNKLDAVFKSRSSSFSLKKDFRSMMQLKGEKNVAYLGRLMNAALRIWDRTDPSINDEIMLTMTVNSNNTKMQEFALRISADGTANRSSYEDLVSQARLVDSLAELKCVPEARVLALSEKSTYVARPVYGANNDTNYGGGKPQSTSQFKSQSGERDRGSRYQSNKFADDNCFRCGAKGHPPYSCPHLNENCRYCKKKGHAIEKCRARLRRQNQREQELYEIPEKKYRANDVNSVEGTNQTKAEMTAKVINDNNIEI